MMNTQVVRWADGTYDTKRTCDECGSTKCAYPVYNDRYKEVGGMEYWAWANGSKHDEDGFVIEADVANPDNLAERTVNAD